MDDRDGLPHQGFREAIFWVLFASWPLYIAWGWYADERPGPFPIDGFLTAGSVLAAVTATAYLLGKWDYQDTQRRFVNQQREDHRLLSQIHDGLAAVGIMRREPMRLQLIRRGRPDEDKSG